MRYFDQTPAVRRCLVLQMIQKHCLNLVCIPMVITGFFAVISSFFCNVSTQSRNLILLSNFLAILFVVIWYYKNLVQKLYRSMREKLSQLNTKLNEYISGMQIIQQFRKKKRLEKEFEETNDDYLKTRVAMIR